MPRKMLIDNGGEKQAYGQECRVPSTFWEQVARDYESTIEQHPESKIRQIIIKIGY